MTKSINPTRFAGVVAAAKAAGTTRQHIWACLHGRRHASPKVADAIARNVTAYAPIKNH